MPWICDLNSQVFLLVDSLYRRYDDEKITPGAIDSPSKALKKKKGILTRY